MFALEIQFHDGISPPETILVRRANAIIGGGESAHVVIEGAGASLSEVRLVRGIGRSFSCHPVRRASNNKKLPAFPEGVFQNEAELRLGDLTVVVTALDSDISIIQDEFPDQAALRILRSALSAPSPLYPAVVVTGSRPIYVSFPSDTPLMIGRSRNCGLRLDASDVSSEHARIGCDEEENIWVEDLGGTNGTFIGEQRVSGRQLVDAGESINVGSEFSLCVVRSEEELEEVGVSHGEPEELAPEEYPCVLTFGEDVQPERVSLRSGSRVSVGRDPANDIWINAPHISRTHLEIELAEDGVVKVVDTSSNGTIYQGEKLSNGQPLTLSPDSGGPYMLDLSAGFKLEVCFGRIEEEKISEAQIFSAQEVSGDLFNSNEVSPLAVSSSRSSDFLEGSALDTTTDPSNGSFSETMRFLAEQEVVSADEFFSEPMNQAPFWENSPQESTQQGIEGDQAASISAGSEKNNSQTRDKSRNFAMDLNPEASQFQESGFDTVLPADLDDSFDAGLPLEQGESLPVASEFEQYQQSQQLSDSEMLSPENDFSLLEEEFGEDILDSPEFRGYSRGFLMVLVLSLILLLLVICLLLFKGGPF